ncbi:MAG: DUF427 domain-containing protein [Arenicellales bacterium]|nr:DUF427 domain-containing protein [Arenicellales bacterium]
MNHPHSLDTNGWHRNPAYVIDFDTLPTLVRVEFGGETVAESSQARVMYELGHAPVYYFPRPDVKMTILEPTDHHTYCPYKGHASYWTLRTQIGRAENAVWSYEKPHEEMAGIADYMGFYWGRMDAWFEGGVMVPGPRDIPGRIGTGSQLKELFPQLAMQWHPTRNTGVKPYEFAANSNELVWWKDDSGCEWQARIRDRVLEVTTLRTDGDATPYD